jgi:hypothetical protein
VSALDAPAYRGAFAGRVRFFLARVPDEARELLRARVFTASGAPIGFEGFDDDIRIGRSASVGRGRLAHGGSWSVSASVLERTAPAAGAPERRERRTCLTLRLTARNGAASTVNGCRDPRRHAAGMLVTLPDCDTRRTVVAALLPPRARRAALVLGDGRRLRLRVRRLPARFGAAERAAFLPVPVGQAVRAVRVGRRVRRLALAPAGLECGSSFEPPGPPLDRSGLPGPFRAEGLDLVTPPTTAVPGADVLARIDLAGRPVELLGTTVADDLCVGLAQPPLMPGGCAPPPLRGRQPRLAGFRPPGGGPAAIALVTAPTVASAALLDLRFAEPRIVASAPTAPAGAGRVALLGMPADRAAQAVRLLDAEAHALADVALPAMATGATRTVARGKSWLATATPLRSAEAIPGGLIPVSRTCVEVGRRATADLAAACADQAPGQVDVVARCAPRLLHVYGVLGGAVRRVTLLLAGGRRRPARIAHGAFHGLLRGRGELRRVELRSAAGRVTGSVRLRAPAPAAQCGYRAREVQAAGGMPFE